MRLKTSLVLLLLVFACLTYCKRSGGRSRGSSSRGSSSYWNRRKSSSDSKPAPKPSAPKEPEIKKEATKVQQSAPPSTNQRPIGWNVDGNNNQKSVHPPSYGEATKTNAGAYPHHPPSYGEATKTNAGVYSHHPPSYGEATRTNAGAYSQAGGYPHNPAYPNSGTYPQHTGGYGGHPNFPNYGGQQQGYPQQAYPGYNPNMGGHQPNMGGYGGYQPNMGGYGGHGYPQQNTGMMGSMFGGNNHGYGGFGGSGGYGMQKSGGFLGQHAFRNILGGMAVGYLVSGLVNRPYRVYSYNNRPEELREEIKLPANMLTLCNENATNICVPGSTAICTQDNKILCVTTMTATTPCQNGGLCVNSTIPCMGADDPLCQNKTTGDNTTTVNMPCFTNMTFEAGSQSLPANVTLPTGTTFCVTAMAVPDPSIPEQNATVPETMTGTNVTQEASATNATEQGPFYGPPPAYGYAPWYYYPPPWAMPENTTGAEFNGTLPAAA